MPDVSDPFHILNMIPNPRFNFKKHTYSDQYAHNIEKKNLHSKDEISNASETSDEHKIHGIIRNDYTPSLYSDFIKFSNLINLK